EGPTPTGGTMPDAMASASAYGDYSVSFERAGRGGRPAGNGIVLALSETRLAEITDGTSQTFFAGEKYSPAGEYDTSSWVGNDQGWDQGFDHDVVRWTKFPTAADGSPPAISDADQVTIYGSAHPAGCQMVNCDGSVVTISYDADAKVFALLG